MRHLTFPSKGIVLLPIIVGQPVSHKVPKGAEVGG